jgi:hypothetical protein
MNLAALIPFAEVQHELYRIGHSSWCFAWGTRVVFSVEFKALGIELEMRVEIQRERLDDHRGHVFLGQPLGSDWGKSDHCYPEYRSLAKPYPGDTLRESYDKAIAELQDGFSVFVSPSTIEMATYLGVLTNEH